MLSSSDHVPLDGNIAACENYFSTMFDELPAFDQPSDDSDDESREISSEDWERVSEMWNNDDTSLSDGQPQFPALGEPIGLVRENSGGLKSIMSLGQSSKSMEFVVQQFGHEFPDLLLDTACAPPSPLNVTSMDKLGDFLDVKMFDKCDLPTVVACPRPDPAPSSSNVVQDVTRLMKINKIKDTVMKSNKKQQKTAQKRNQKPKKTEFIHVDDITPFDVYCERGGRANNHCGNHRFLKEAYKRQPSYKSPNTSKVEKSRIARELLAHIKSSEGRFLKRFEDDKTRTLYYVVPDVVARRKCSQALREYKPSR